MTTPVIIDAVVVIILVAFCYFGGKRGLFQALAGLLTVIVALVGAGIVAATFSGPVTNLVAPLLEQRVEEKVDQALGGSGQMPEASAEQDGDFGIEELLALVGLDADVRESLAQQAQDAVRDTGVSVAAAVVSSITGSMVYGLLYILAFAGITVLLHVLMGAMDLVLKLPVLHGLNTVGGAAVGLIQGALVLFFAVWVLRRLGISFDTEALAEAHILKIFTANTPLSVLSFLR